jgi:hypothetical protein
MGEEEEVTTGLRRIDVNEKKTCEMQKNTGGTRGGGGGVHLAGV